MSVLSEIYADVRVRFCFLWYSEWILILVESFDFLSSYSFYPTKFHDTTITTFPFYAYMSTLNWCGFHICRDQIHWRSMHRTLLARNLIWTSLGSLLAFFRMNTITWRLVISLNVNIFHVSVWHDYIKCCFFLGNPLFWVVENIYEELQVRYSLTSIISEGFNLGFLHIQLVLALAGPGKARGEDRAAKPWKDRCTQKKDESCWFWKIAIIVLCLSHSSNI